MRPPAKITSSDVRELNALAEAYADARYLDQLIAGSAAAETLYGERNLGQITTTNTTRAAYRLAEAARAIFGLCD